MAVQSAKDITIFTGSMDGDTQARFISKGNYIKLINGRNTITNNGDNGAIEDTEGNILVFNQYLALGRNKVVGSYEDVKEKSIIFFVWNSFGYHGIFRWYQESPGNPLGEIQKIFQVENPSIYDEFNLNPLNFNEDYLITGIALVENLLNWNCYNDEPKQMDIVKANETRKKRVFDLFFNNLSLNTIVTFSFTLVDENGNTVSSISVNDNSTSVVDRVTNVANAINQYTNLGFSAIDKIDYIQLECQSIGKNTIQYNDNGSDKGRLLPANFYFNDVPGNFFYRIQMPPNCPPIAYYIPTQIAVGQNPNGSNNLSINYQGYQTSTATQWEFTQLGILNALNDVNNNVIVNSTNYSYNGLLFVGELFTPSINLPLDGWNQPTGYIYNNGSVPLTNIPVRLRCSLNIYTGTGTNAFLDVGLFAMNNSIGISSPGGISGGSTNNESYIFFEWKVPQANAQYTGYTTFNIDKTVTMSLPTAAGWRWYLGVHHFQVGFIISDVSIQFNSEPDVVSQLVDERIEIQSASFRAKYIYENFQNSVYGAATALVLRTSAYKFQKKIFLNFFDNIIQNDFYATRLKNIVLSITLDGGTTWYDFANIKKYNFICENNATYTYLANESLLAVSPEEAELQFHSVPIRAQSLEYADSRLIDGGIVEGYDNIDVIYDINCITYDIIGPQMPHYSVQAVISNPTVTPTNIYLENPISVEGFRFGYTGRIGIVYYDDYDRKTGVLLGENSYFEVPHYNKLQVGVQYNTNDYLYPADYLVNKIQLKIYNEPPNWATKYRIVRTRDFSQVSYLIWCIDKKETVNAEGVVTGVNPKYYKIYVTNIGYYTSKTARGAIIEYTYEKGDRVKLISYNPAGGFEPILTNDVIDYPILEAGPDYFYIEYNPSIVGLESGSIVEIYSKGQQNIVTDPLFYEMSSCLEIKTGNFNGVVKKYHTGNLSIQSNQTYGAFGTQSPAIVELNQGGVYFRFREMIWDTTGSLKSRKMWISSNYADEFNVSNYDCLFRPNIPLEKGQVSLPSAIRFSDPYKSGTEINGLSAYSPLNIEKYSDEYGLLKKLKLIDNDVVKAVFENSFQLSLYIKQGVIKQNQGNTALISVTDNVISNSHIIQRTLGTQNPESVVLNDEGDCFGYDENKGVVWRSSGNGLVQVSDYLQKTNFKNWSNYRNIYNKKKSQTPSVYDIYHDEYIITLGRIPAVELQLPKAYVKLSNENTPITIDIIIEETGLVIASGVVLSSANFYNDIISIFNSAGFSASLLNPNSNPLDGTILVEAPNLSYSELNIIVDITYQNKIIVSDNMILNGNFEIPISSSIPWSCQASATAVEYIVSNHVTVGPPDFSLSRLFEKPVVNPEIDGYCIQKNMGFKTGKSYLFNVLYKGQSIRIGIGKPSGINSQNSFALAPVGPISPAASVSFTLTYTDATLDYDWLHIQMLEYSNFKGEIFSISMYELSELNQLVRFKFDKGVQPEAKSPFEPLTISFNKQKNGWTHYYSFTPEYYGKINDNIVSFKDGDLYIHTSNAIPKNYYGVQYDRELTFVSNKDFPKVKVFKELMINGLGENSAPVLSIPPYEGVPTGMESELTSAHFSVKEGMQYAAIQRDKLTPGFSNTNLAWLNGRNMRGQIIIVTLKNTQPIQSLIYSTEILYFYSENS